MDRIEITSSELLADIEAAGITADLRHPDDVVYDYIVAHCGESGRPPKLTEIAAHLGVALTTASNAIYRLKSRGRIRVPRRGVYVPVFS